MARAEALGPTGSYPLGEVEGSYAQWPEAAEHGEDRSAGIRGYSWGASTLSADIYGNDFRRVIRKQKLNHGKQRGMDKVTKL